MKKPLLLLICLSFYLASYAQKAGTGLFIYDYEKVGDAFMYCDVYIYAVNGTKKGMSIDSKGIPHHFSKELTKELIDGVQGLLDSKAGKTKNGKRESELLLSDNKTSIYFDDKDNCIITFDPTDKVATYQTAMKRLFESLKLAYDKL